MSLPLPEKEKIEINYWKESNFESPSNFTKENFLNKTQELRHFEYKAKKHHSCFSTANSVLEIGAGQGWASCFLKKYYLPDASFVVSDISEYALQSTIYWESVFDIKLEKTLPAKSYDIDQEDNSFDFVFCYAAAHHFVEYEKTLKELHRILKVGGKALFIYEPVSSKFFYPLYYKYVNSMPHSTPEDVIIPKELLEMANNLGFDSQVHYDSTQSIRRSFITSAYFSILRKFSFLEPLLPASADFEFTKT